VGIGDIVWIAGDISKAQYTRTEAAIRTAFSIALIEKAMITVSGWRAL
jgi:hypothetical protein